MIWGTNEVTHIYDDYVTINLPFAHSIKSNNNYIYQLNNSDIIITILGTLGRLSHKSINKKKFGITKVQFDHKKRSIILVKKTRIIVGKDLDLAE